MRALFRVVTVFLLLLSSTRLLSAQDEFYNRDSSGYTYRIGPVLPKIQQDWRLGTVGGEAVLRRVRRSIPRHHGLRYSIYNGQDFKCFKDLRGRPATGKGSHH